MRVYKPSPQDEKFIIKMPRQVKGHILPDSRFSFPFRMILSGSSGSGKTYFAGELLQRPDLFEDQIDAVVYYYPCYLSEAPVTWHKQLAVPVSYHVGIPTKQDLMNLAPKTCVVIDDSFDEAIKSSAIDHLFRVISGKRNICVIIMTQNNFSKGKYGREIRNSCNFTVMFRNCCDVSINENIARMAGLKKAYDAALNSNYGQQYPYLFLDQSQKGQLSPYRLYTDIYSRHKIVFSVDGMKAVVIGAQDFEQFFDLFSNGLEFTAEEKNANKPTKVSQTKEPSNEESRGDSTREFNERIRERRIRSEERRKRRKIFTRDLHKN